MIVQWADRGKFQAEAVTGEPVAFALHRIVAPSASKGDCRTLLTTETLALNEIRNNRPTHRGEVIRLESLVMVADMRAQTGHRIAVVWWDQRAGYSRDEWAPGHVRILQASTDPGLSELLGMELAMRAQPVFGHRGQAVAIDLDQARPGVDPLRRDRYEVETLLRVASEQNPEFGEEIERGRLLRRKDFGWPPPLTKADQERFAVLDWRHTQRMLALDKD